MKIKDKDVMEILNSIAILLDEFHEELELNKAHIQFLWDELLKKEFPEPKNKRSV